MVMAVFCWDFKENGTDDPSHWQIGEHWQLFRGKFYFTAIVDLKFVGTWAPTNKIIRDIPGFTMLNVTIFQAQHNTGNGIISP